MMSEIVKLYLIAFHVLIGCAVLAKAIDNCPGCVDLDEWTFDKVIKRFPYAIVKFDTAYPYGEKHEAFAAFSKAANTATDDLLVATVSIKDYGDNENKLLAKRYNINEMHYPGVLLFRNGHTGPLRFDQSLDVTVDNLKQFLNTNTDLYFGCDGCLKEFDALSVDFADLNLVEQQNRLDAALDLIETLDKPQHKAYAEVYKLFMEKIISKGYDFVKDESKRLSRIKSGKITKTKKQELNIKLNILNTFRLKNSIKQEL